MTDLFGPVCPCCGQPVQEAQRTPFDAFWQKWPDRRAKQPAEKAWGKLAPAEQKVALDRCEAWCREWRKRNPDASHIMASSYLNQRRFLDEGETPKQADQGTVLEMWGKAIREGKGFLVRNLTPIQARAVVDAGHATEEECRKVGVL